MRLRAYPEIGQRITISQGKGSGPSSRDWTRWPCECRFALTIRGRMDDKFVVRPLRGSECVLNEAHGAVVEGD